MTKRSRLSRSSLPIVLALLTVAGGRVGAAAEPSQPSNTPAVLPGDARLDLERLVPHRATWRVTIHDAPESSTVQGLWTDTWVRSEEQGRPVVVFRQLFADTRGKVLMDNETVFDATSFRALRSTQHMPPSGAHVVYRYEGDTVSGTLREDAGNEPRQFEVVFDEPVWEPLALALVLVLIVRQIQQSRYRQAVV